jgi:VanZ family protein
MLNEVRLASLTPIFFQARPRCVIIRGKHAAKKGYRDTMRKILAWAAVILWMALIFFFSAQAAEQSDQLSIGIAEKIAEAVEKVIPGTGLVAEGMNHFVRKNAHFFVYLVLGALTVNALCTSGVRGLRGVAAAMAVCVLYAVSDEIHQIFVPGRSGQFTDVLIDSAGAAVGSLIIWFIRRKPKKTGNMADSTVR